MQVHAELDALGVVLSLTVLNDKVGATAQLHPSNGSFAVPSPAMRVGHAQQSHRSHILGRAQEQALALQSALRQKDNSFA